MPRLLVASQDGYLYIYNIDPVEGGECTLLKQHRYSMGRSGERVDSPGVLTRVSKSYYPKKGALNKLNLERESLEVQWSLVLSRDPGSHGADN